MTRVQPALRAEPELGFRGRGPAADEPLRWESAHGREGGPRGRGRGAAWSPGTASSSSSRRPSSTGGRRAARGDPAVRAGGGDAEPALAAAGRGGGPRGGGPAAARALLTAGRRDGRGRRHRPAAGTARTVGLGSSSGRHFQDVHPPLAVVDAYRDVSRAESDRQRRVNEAGDLAGREAGRRLGPGPGRRPRRRGPRRAAAAPAARRGRRLRLPARRPRGLAPALTDSGSTGRRSRRVVRRQAQAGARRHAHPAAA